MSSVVDVGFGLGGSLRFFPSPSPLRRGGWELRRAAARAVRWSPLEARTAYRVLPALLLFRPQCSVGLLALHRPAARRRQIKPWTVLCVHTLDIQVLPRVGPGWRCGVA